MSEETMNQNTEQKPTNSNPEDKNGDPGSGRTFTQEEVNRIVADRLAKERAKASKSVDPETDHASRSSLPASRFWNVGTIWRRRTRTMGRIIPLSWFLCLGQWTCRSLKTSCMSSSVLSREWQIRTKSSAAAIRAPPQTAFSAKPSV